MDKTTKMVEFKILQIDSCEYLRINGYYGFAHKGNCRLAVQWLEERKEIIGISFQEDFIEEFKTFIKGE